MHLSSRHHGSRWYAAFLVCSTLATAGCSGEGAALLPALSANIDETSVSGVSSGAYMAGQFEVAHSRRVVGAAIIAGGPYGCAQAAFADLMPGPGTAFLNLSKAVNGCMRNALAPWGIPDPKGLAEKTKRLAEEGLIDPIEALANDRVYLFAGTEDLTVVPAIVRSAYAYYAKLGLLPSQVKLVEDVSAGHGFVTEDHGEACEHSGAPYIVDCDYDQAGELLRHIYGRLGPRSAAASGSLRIFDQRPFTNDLADHGMSDEGLVYVPAFCATAAACRVHVAFHGCAQSRASVGDAFARDTGFARWADTNRIIVLFPQVAPGTLNPQACWDWWGYTGREYLTRNAPQIVAVHRMLERLAATPGAG